MFCSPTFQKGTWQFIRLKSNTRFSHPKLHLWHAHIHFWIIIWTDRVHSCTQVIKFNTEFILNVYWCTCSCAQKIIGFSCGDSESSPHMVYPGVHWAWISALHSLMLYFLLKLSLYRTVSGIDGTCHIWAGYKVGTVSFLSWPSTDLNVSIHIKLEILEVGKDKKEMRYWKPFFAWQCSFRQFCYSFET